jgi:hypothetical protein
MQMILFIVFLLFNNFNNLFQPFSGLFPYYSALMFHCLHTDSRSNAQGVLSPHARHATFQIVNSLKFPSASSMGFCSFRTAAMPPQQGQRFSLVLVSAISSTLLSSGS